MRIQPSFGARVLHVRVEPEDGFRPIEYNYVDDALRRTLVAPNAGEHRYTTFNPYNLGRNPFPASGIPEEPRQVLRGERLMLTPGDHAEIEKRMVGKPWTEREKILRELWERARALPALNLVFDLLRPVDRSELFRVQLRNHADLNGVDFESPPLAKAGAAEEEH